MTVSSTRDTTNSVTTPKGTTMRVLDFFPDTPEAPTTFADIDGFGYWVLAPIAPTVHHYKDKKTGADKSWTWGSVGDYTAEYVALDPVTFLAVDEECFDLGRFRSRIAAEIAANRTERRLRRGGKKKAGA